MSDVQITSVSTQLLHCDINKKRIEDIIKTNKPVRLFNVCECMALKTLTW